MLVNDVGIIISSIRLQFSNANIPTVVNEFDKTTSSNLKQSLNAYSPIDSTVFGITTLLKFSNPLN